MNVSSDNLESQMAMSHDDIAKSVTTALPGVDTLRVTGYTQLGQLRDAKARSLTREQALLAQKHGNATTPRVTLAQQRFATNELLRREIAVFGEIADTPVPTVSTEGIVVHGFVRHRSDNSGIAGLTVGLTSLDGTWVRALGYTSTDQRGYFLLDTSLHGTFRIGSSQDIRSNLSVEEAKKAAEQKAAQGMVAGKSGTPSSGGAGSSTGSSNSSIGGKREVQLRIFDREGHTLHTESRPVLLQPGTVDYRYILLDDSTATTAATPPPDTSGGQPVVLGPKVSAQPAGGITIPSQKAGSRPARVGGLKRFASTIPAAKASAPTETPPPPSAPAAKPASKPTRKKKGKA